MKFNEYRELRETADFNLKFKILLKQIKNSGLSFDEYWISHGLPRLIEGAYSNHNELLDRMLLQEVNWGSLAGKGMAGAGRGAQWLGNKMVDTGNRWQQPQAQSQEAPQAQSQEAPQAQTDPTQNYSYDTGQPNAITAGANKAMDIMAGQQSSDGMSAEPGPAQSQPQQQGTSMQDVLTQNFAQALKSFIGMSQDPSIAPAAQDFAKQIDAAGKPIIQKMVASMANQPASQTAGMGNQGVGSGSQVAMGNYA
jgi:hypothetical protein